MSAFGQAIYDALAGNAAVANAVALWHGTPAIFVADDAPDDAPRPYVVSPAALERVRELDLDDPPLQSALRQVFVYGDRPDSQGTLEQLSEEVARTLKGLVIPGAIMSGVEVAGPTGTDPTRQEYGRIVTVEAAFTEEP